MGLAQSVLSLFHKRAEPARTGVSTFTLGTAATHDTLTAFGINPVNSGVTVNADTALRFSAWYACVRILSETLASMPLHIYRRKDDGGRDVAREHPLYSVLHTTPNSIRRLSRFSFLTMLEAHVDIYGNAYALIERDRAGRVLNLWPIHPSCIRPIIDETGNVLYKVHYDSGAYRNYTADQVLHVKGLMVNPDSLVGLSPLAYAREQLGLGLAAEEYGARFFGNGGQPAGVFEHPAKLGEKAAENIRESFAQNHGKLAKSHRALVLQEGMTWKPITIPPEEAQFLLTRQFQVEEIARMFRIPLIFLQHGKSGTAWGTGIEQTSIAFEKYTMRPVAARWEQEINQTLLDGGEEYYAEFDTRGILRADIASRFTAYVAAVNNGIMSPNECRALENMDKYSGGDTYLIQGAMRPIETAGAEFGPAQSAIDESDPSAPPTQEDSEDDPEDQSRSAKLNGTARLWRRLLIDAFERAAKKQSSLIRSRVEKVPSELRSKTIEELFADDGEASRSVTEEVCDALADFLVELRVEDSRGEHTRITKEYRDSLRKSAIANEYNARLLASQFVDSLMEARK